jgi:hypothetical protein
MFQSTCRSSRLIYFAKKERKSNKTRHKYFITFSKALGNLWASHKKYFSSGLSFKENLVHVKYSKEKWDSNKLNW